MTELRAIDHTNPHTGETFGETQTYGRGRVAADGGVRDADTGTGLGGVSHTPPRNAPTVNVVYDRGCSDEF